jgi:hypothetical protein
MTGSNPPWSFPRSNADDFWIGESEKEFFTALLVKIRNMGKNPPKIQSSQLPFLPLHLNPHFA